MRTRAIERLGSNRVVSLDLRLIAASNRDPKEAVREGKLREDLYYPLNVFSIQLPPLREHSEDVAGLVDHFIAKHGEALRNTRLSAAALTRLTQYGWPGNVRELENMVERALILSGGGLLDQQHFSLDSSAHSAPSSQQGLPEEAADVRLNEAVDKLEARLIEAALTKAGGSKARAAALLDISERALWYKLKKRRPEPG